jgi:hypothetical protein
LPVDGSGRPGWNGRPRGTRGPWERVAPPSPIPRTRRAC